MRRREERTRQSLPAGRGAKSEGQRTNLGRPELDKPEPPVAPSLLLPTDPNDPADHALAHVDLLNRPPHVGPSRADVDAPEEEDARGARRARGNVAHAVVCFSSPGRGGRPGDTAPATAEGPGGGCVVDLDASGGRGPEGQEDVGEARGDERGRVIERLEQGKAVALGEACWEEEKERAGQQRVSERERGGRRGGRRRTGRLVADDGRALGLGGRHLEEVEQLGCGRRGTRQSASEPGGAERKRRGRGDRRRSPPCPGRARGR